MTDVVRPGRVKGRAALSLRFTNVTVDGERSAISTGPITVEGEGDVKGDATKIGVGAGVGAVVGGILGGGDGAAKGAAIGGAAGTGAVLATRGKDVVLASGTTLSTTLAAAEDRRAAAVGVAGFRLLRPSLRLCRLAGSGAEPDPPVAAVAERLAGRGAAAAQGHRQLGGTRSTPSQSTTRTSSPSTMQRAVATQAARSTMRR